MHAQTYFCTVERGLSLVLTEAGFYLLSPFPLSLPTFCVFVTASVKLNDTWQSGVYLQHKKIK